MKFFKVVMHFWYDSKLMCFMAEPIENNIGLRACIVGIAREARRGTWTLRLSSCFMLWPKFTFSHIFILWANGCPGMELKNVNFSQQQPYRLLCPITKFHWINCFKQQGLQPELVWLFFLRDELVFNSGGRSISCTFLYTLWLCHLDN